MLSAPPVSKALSFFREELESGHRELAELTARVVWSAFLCFGRQRFGTVATPDSDGLLFQISLYEEAI